jgi:hypothetical protein
MPKNNAPPVYQAKYISGRTVGLQGPFGNFKINSSAAEAVLQRQPYAGPLGPTHKILAVTT